MTLTPSSPELMKAFKSIETIEVNPMTKIPPRPTRIPAYRSDTERQYTEYLELLRRTGEIVNWFYEDSKWKLADGTYYIPDFMVVYKDKIVFVEIKGYTKGRFGEKGVLKFKWCAERYKMFYWRLVQKNKGNWETVLEK